MCMCGDYMCGSCGPAQGFDPRFEKFFEEFCETSEKAKEIYAGAQDPDSDETLDLVREAAQEAYEAKYGVEDDTMYNDLAADLEEEAQLAYEHRYRFEPTFILEEA